MSNRSRYVHRCSSSIGLFQLDIVYNVGAMIKTGEDVDTSSNQESSGFTLESATSEDGSIQVSPKRKKMRKNKSEH